MINRFKEAQKITGKYDFRKYCFDTGSELFTFLLIERLSDDGDEQSSLMLIQKHRNILKALTDEDCKTLLQKTCTIDFEDVEGVTEVNKN